MIIFDVNNDTSKIAIKKDKIICNACNEIISFFDDLNSNIITKHIDLVKKPKAQIKESYHMCSNIKCKNSYQGKICPKCNTPNILFIKKNKKKKKKK